MPKRRSKHEDTWAAILGVLLVAAGWQSVFDDLHIARMHDVGVDVGSAVMVFGGMLIGAALSKSAAKREKLKKQ